MPSSGSREGVSAEKPERRPAEKSDSVWLVGLAIAGVAFGFSDACLTINNGLLVGILSQYGVIIVVAGVVNLLRKRDIGLGPEATYASLVLSALALLPFLFVNSVGENPVYSVCHLIQFIALGAFFISAFCKGSGFMRTRRQDIPAGITLTFCGIALGWILSAAALHVAGASSVLLHSAASAIIVALVAYVFVIASSAVRAARHANAAVFDKMERRSEDATADADSGASFEIGGSSVRVSGETLHRLAHTVGLSRREEQVLTLLAQGKSARGIAGELVVSDNTVKTHVRNVYRKLGVHSREDLERFITRKDDGE